MIGFSMPFFKFPTDRDAASWICYNFFRLLGTFFSYFHEIPLDGLRRATTLANRLLLISL